MKLIMTLLVRDEQDILAANIDYHLSQGVDFIIVTDNLSADSTPDILADYQRQGVVQVITETRDDYSQHEWVTRMARIAATEHGADWVINNDADEFWWPLADNSLKSYFARLPAHVQAVTVPRHNFPVFSADESDLRPFYERLIFKDTASENALGRPLPPKVCHRAHADIHVGQGNHTVSLTSENLAAPAGELVICHYPARSYAQFANKIRLGGAAYARNTVLDKAIGHTWRYLYDQYNEGRLQDFYLQQIPDTPTLANLIDSGRYVADLQLRDYLRQLYRQP